MSDIESRLRYRIDSLEIRIAELERENSKLRDERDSAEYRVRNELEPRLRQAAKDYDSWATSPERGM